MGDVPDLSGEPRESRALARASGVAGGVAGAAAGSFAGPPGMVAGAVAGQFVPEVVTAVVREFRERVLSPRERERTDGVLAQIAGGVSARIAAGEVPRPDWFEDGGRDGRELIEGVALAASREYRERKQPFLARFYASLVFRPDVSGEEAHHLLTVLERLTWRQCVALAVFGARSIEQTTAGRPDIYGNADVPVPDSLEIELDGLHALGLWSERDPEGKFVMTYAMLEGRFGGMPLGARDRVALTPVGELLHDLAGLKAIGDAERRHVLGQMYGVE